MKSSIINMLLTFLSLLFLSATTLGLPTTNDDISLIERQIGCIGSTPCVVLDGNGDPHQQILHKQLSVWINCGGATCGVTQDQQKSYTLTSDFHGLSFITGGFDVVQSVQTGTHDGCTGQPGKTVCVWSAIWHTDFTVKTGTRNPCFSGCDAGDATTVVRAPNLIHPGGTNYYCAYDDACGDQGQEFWVAGPAMGPPNSAALDKRQSCVPSGSCTSLEGNGDPHQWVLHKQLSPKLICGGTYCTVYENEETDYKISANTHGLDWISGEFDVGTGFHNGCTGGGQNPGTSVCTKTLIWHTDYTVRGGIANTCSTGDCIEYDDTTIIRSPNQLHHGVEYYCAWDDDCAERGAETWIFAGAGGPPTAQALDTRNDLCLFADCHEPVGDTHQWIKRKQVSDPFACHGYENDPSCPLPSNIIKSQAVGADIPDEAVYNDFGYAVAPLIHTGLPGHSVPWPQGNECTAKPGEVVCMHADLWHTVIYEKVGKRKICTPNWYGVCEGTQHTVSMPNVIKDQVNFRCRKNNDCGDMGYQAYVDANVLGGPP